MGQIINLDNFEGSYPDLLTRTGQGGFLSTGYLRDKPAVSTIESDETPQFVLTNKKTGVRVEADGNTEHVRPGSGYRTITVLTDRRVLIFVGGGSADGDRQFVVPFAEVETVDSEASLRHGRLVFQRDGETRWQINCGTDGLAEVTDFLDRASQAWVHVENTLDDVKRQLVVATEARDRGEYDAALTGANRANEILDTARETAANFNSDRPGDALSSRVEVVRERCLRTLSEVRVGRAREATDDGEGHWRADEYEAAYDAYDRAREEYDAALSLDRYIEDVDEIIAERDRLDTIVDHLEESPLRKAVAADNRAAAANEPAEAAENWAEALDHYRTTLEVDWGADERRFAGDTEKIRDRLRTVAENLTAARRSVASDAMSAGDWYTDAEQYEAALEEFTKAREAFEQALETARDCYPDAVDHLQTELDALQQRIDQTNAVLDGEERSISGRIEGDDEPEYDVEATIGTTEPDDDEGDDEPETANEIEAAIDAVENGEGPDEAGRTTDSQLPMVDRLRDVDSESFCTIVSDVLTESGWSVTQEPADVPFDLTAERSVPESQQMAVLVVHRSEQASITTETIDRCVELRNDTDRVGAVMLATSNRIDAATSRDASQQKVRLLDDECLSAIIEARDLELPASPRRVVED